jgi:hypothetical protein
MKAQRFLILALAPVCLLLGACGAASSLGGTGGNGSGGNGTGGNGTGGDGTGGSATGGTGTSTGGHGTGGAISTGGTGTGGAATGGAGGKGTGGSAGGKGGGAGSPATGGSGGVPTTGTGGNSNGAPVYNPDFKEFSGDDCPAATPKDVSISGQLPNLFTKIDGTTMSKKSEWRCRRAELKAIVEKYIHGAKPGPPDMVTGTVTATQITVNVTNGGKSISFKVPVTMPSGAKGPVPIIIGLGGSSLSSSVVMAEGVATGNYDHQTMDSETSRTGLFTQVNSGSSGVSAQIGWAWGMSRIIDVLLSEKAAGRNNIIDPYAVGVTGCSRNGKGAFTVGAFDERIALGIPQESGTGGVSAFRIVNTNPMGPNNKPAQSLSSAWSEAQGWFGSVFQPYTSGTKVDTVPGDTSSIAAMYAPRGLLVLDNSRIGELCATCQHAATDAAMIMYKALGIPANVGYNGGNPSDPQDHCTFYPTTQTPPLQRAIRGHLTKTMPPDGRMEPQPAGTADLSKWVPWSSSAPTLADDVSWASPPLTAQ